MLVVVVVVRPGRTWRARSPLAVVAIAAIAASAADMICVESDGLPAYGTRLPRDPEQGTTSATQVGRYVCM
ncbi:hypothetical protein GGR56DRAFT_630164 [Xylariaceae sp. FL0804]|nr:hypothetical protein GGR56DRAFT_630164 [Xylariaceae sp. FL0804]